MLCVCVCAGQLRVIVLCIEEVVFLSAASLAQSAARQSHNLNT